MSAKKKIFIDSVVGNIISNFPSLIVKRQELLALIKKLSYGLTFESTNFLLEKEVAVSRFYDYFDCNHSKISEVIKGGLDNYKKNFICNHYSSLLESMIFQTPAINDFDVNSKIMKVNLFLSRFNAIYDLSNDKKHESYLLSLKSCNEILSFLFSEYLSGRSNFSYRDGKLYYCCSGEVSFFDIDVKFSKVYIELDCLKLPLKFNDCNEIIESIKQLEDYLLGSTEKKIVEMVNLELKSIPRNLMGVAGIDDLYISDCSLEEVKGKIKFEIEKIILNAKKTSNKSLIGNEEYRVIEKRENSPEVYFYYGETNSGKTYEAFNHFVGAESGLYLSPLKVLALEGQAKIKDLGHGCDLVIGDKKDVSPENSFRSSTVELATSDYYDVVIIDEFQMLLSDKERGYAWLKALLKVNTKKLIVTGTEDVLPHLQFICKKIDFKMIACKKDRLVPLRFDAEGIGSLMDIKPRSAIIAFTMNDVLHLKREFESMTGRKASVLFGCLPPAIRQQESDKFCSGRTDILITTDVISMGVNLPIQAVYFSSLVKFDGYKEDYVSPSLCRQIIGRAGRYGIYNEGLYGTLFGYDDFTLKMLLSQKSPSHPYLYPYKPDMRLVKAIFDNNRNFNIYDILNNYKENFYIKESYLYKADISRELAKADIIANEFCDIPINIAYLLVNSSLELRPDNKHFFVAVIRAIKRRKDISRDYLSLHKIEAVQLSSFDKIKDLLEIWDFYLWLVSVMPDIFLEHTDFIRKEREVLISLLSKFLSKNYTV